MHVRLATLDDYPVIWDLLTQRFYKEHQQHNAQFRLDDDKTKAYIEYHLKHGFVWLTNDNLGSLSLSLREAWWSKDCFLADGWFYVAPEVRSIRVTKALLAEAEKTAERLSIPLIVGVFNSHDAERKHNLFRRLGFAPLGGWYILDVLRRRLSSPSSPSRS